MPRPRPPPPRRPQRSDADRQIAIEASAPARPIRGASRGLSPVTICTPIRLRAPRQRVGQRAAGKAGEEAGARAADDDLGDVLALRVAQDFVGQVVADEPRRLGPEALRQGAAPRRRSVARAARFAARLVDGRGDPARVEAGREPARRPDDVQRQRVRPDADEQALGGLPRALDRALAQLLDHLVVDPRRGAAQRDLAQRREVAQGEELLLREPRRLGHIDLAVLEALDQLLGGEIDQHDVVGVAQHDVGHGFAHGDAGDARDDVGEAVEVLDVERRPDVDARVEQFFDILPALGMAAVGRVGVGELVDDDQLGPAAQRAVEIELLDLAALPAHDAARQDFETVRQRFGLGARMGLDQADDDVDALLAQQLRALQHGVGLADAGRGAEEHQQAAAPILLGQRQQRVGIGSAFGISVVGQGVGAFRFGPSPV